jgi:hypothetical protein
LDQALIARRGFYNYDWLENIFGSDIQRVDHVVPKLQNLKQADTIWLAKEYFGSVPAAQTAVEIYIDGKKVRGTITANKPDGDYLLAAYMPGAGCRGGTNQAG